MNDYYYSHCADGETGSCKPLGNSKVLALSPGALTLPWGLHPLPERRASLMSNSSLRLVSWTLGLLQTLQPQGGADVSVAILLPLSSLHLSRVSSASREYVWELRAGE